MFKPIGQDQYVDELTKLLLQRGVEGPIVREPNEFAVRIGESNIMYLANFYAEYCSAPFFKRAQLLNQVASRISALKTAAKEDMTADAARHCLRPVIRHRMFREGIELEPRLRGEELGFAPVVVIGGHLGLELGIDSPGLIANVRKGELDEWGIGFDEALAIANDNLARAIPARFAQVRPGLYQSQFGDMYDASRLHLPQFVPSLRVKGRPVAMVPNRSVLLVTGSDDADGLVHMSKLARDVLGQPRPLSGIAFRLDSAWTPFLPPQDHPAFTLLETLFLSDLAQSYADQAQILNKVHEDLGIDVFVATASHYIDRKTGKSTILATWAEGIETLLPEATTVGFSSYDQQSMYTADWPRVREVVGNLMEATEMYPERYRLTRYPTDEQFRAMGARRMGPS
jgi:hypothetical protein